MAQHKLNRFYTGVSFEPEVSEYLNDLARRMGMNRSWVLNTIVYEYAKIVEMKKITPLISRLLVDRSNPIINIE
jgi:hypothetical protein